MPKYDKRMVRLSVIQYIVIMICFAIIGAVSYWKSRISEETFQTTTSSSGDLRIITAKFGATEMTGTDMKSALEGLIQDNRLSYQVTNPPNTINNDHKLFIAWQYGSQPMQSGTYSVGQTLNITPTPTASPGPKPSLNINLSTLDPMNPGALPDDTALVFYSVRGMTRGMFVKHKKPNGTIITIQDGSGAPASASLNKNEIRRVLVPNFQIGDKLQFYYLDSESYDASLLGRGIPANYDNPAFVGHVYWNGSFYPSNLANFNAIGSAEYDFKRLGCYAPDIGDRNFTPAPMTAAEAENQQFFSNPLACAIKARESNNQYSALRGGKCYVARETYEMNPVSEARCASEKLNGNDGETAYDIYDVTRHMELRECGASDIAGLNYPGTRILRNKVGNGCNSRGVFLFLQFEPQVTLRDAAGNPLRPFCPDPDYAEFNAAGCNNPESRATCVASVREASNFIAKQNSCETPLRDYFSGTDVDVNIPDLIQYVVNAYQLSVSFNMNETWRTRLMEGIQTLLRASCNILQLDEEYFNINKCVGKFTDPTNPDYQKGKLAAQAIGAIMKAGEHCQRDSDSYSHQSRAYCQQYQDALRTLYHWSRVVMAHVYTPQT